jgi:hypothetical protein
VKEVEEQFRRAIISSAFEVCPVPERALDPIECCRDLVLPTVGAEQR